jgi:hypothetical protein
MIGLSFFKSNFLVFIIELMFSELLFSSNFYTVVAPSGFAIMSLDDRTEMDLFFLYRFDFLSICPGLSDSEQLASFPTRLIEFSW